MFLPRNFDQAVKAVLNEGKLHPQAAIEEAQKRYPVLYNAACGRILNNISERKNEMAWDLETEKFREKFIRFQEEETDRAKFRKAAIHALSLRSGILKAKTAEEANTLYGGYSTRELMREALRFAGQPDSGRPSEITTRALTSSDFPYVLANVANKFLFEGYASEPQTWRDWVATGIANDFKQLSIVRPSETDDLDLLPESSEYKVGGRTEAREVTSVLTFGKLYEISRQAIINDDLSAIFDPAIGHGEAASRKISDLVYSVLTTNAAMGDGVLLFHLTHANIGAGGVLSITTLGEGMKLMALQKDLQGLRKLNIRAQFFVAPVALEAVGEQFFNSASIGGEDPAAAGRALLANPYGGTRFTRIYEPRLDDHSATAFYLAGPRGKTLKLFFLQGIETPYLEAKQGWEVDGISYKVRIDAACKALDHRALVYNAGA